MRAAAACERGQFLEAERFCAAILGVQPGHFVALQILAMAQARRGLSIEALASCDKALAIQPEHAGVLHNRGAILQELERFGEALASYDKALAVRPDFAETHYNRGVVLHALKRFEAALSSYQEALAIRPAHAATLNNRGITLHELKRFEEALSSYDQALEVERDRAGTFNNRGYALQELNRFEEARASFEQAIALDPAHKHALGGVADCALKLCDWTRRDELSGELRRQVTQAGSIVYPFVLLGYSDDAALHLRGARQFIRDRIGVLPRPLWSAAGGRDARIRSDRIKLVYMSTDFRAHPVAQLVAELFELHDRSRFEVIGVSLGPDDGSDMRARLIRAFDQYYDVRTTPDREVARLLHELGTDIVVDLNGYTMGCRPEILAWRPAPVAVNYLGYPGTMGVDFIDYVIADPIVLPFDRQPCYAEKIVHLPDCYQANDRKRAIAERAPRREDVGLPARGFVFCCFNGAWKISPAVFDVWMRLLAVVDGSVLWLLHERKEAEANLRREAAARGVDPARLVFAGRMPLDDHLARHRLADLFLDTLPYNAHTTASDALWAGLPVLTACGESFAGRVAASLLNAVGLPDLVTENLDRYEAMARKLADHASLLDGFRERLERNRLQYPLFDSARFCGHIETAFGTMWERWQRGQSPESFSVAALGGSREPW
jgi:predicted O-linked N-acetylglucosamine transferase (SPINDLY family)